MAIDSQNPTSDFSSSSSSSNFSTSSSSPSTSSQASKPASPTTSASAPTSTSAPTSNQNAMDLLRGSVVGVLENVVREYEPQIAQFTQNFAHQAVDRGVAFAQTAGQRIQKQSWMRLGLAAALGVGIVAVLGYEATEAATSATDRSRSSVH